jgi:DNA-binding CsgD family transcriptional regulator
MCHARRRKIGVGRAFHQSGVGKSMEKTDEVFPKLTAREIEVIGFLAIGYSSKQIATEMKIATNTVNNHRQSMLKKNNSKSTGELVNFAIKAGFV